jgi:hypothetical protein
MKKYFPDLPSSLSDGEVDLDSVFNSLLLQPTTDLLSPHPLHTAICKRGGENGASACHGASVDLTGVVSNARGPTYDVYM